MKIRAKVLLSKIKSPGWNCKFPSKWETQNFAKKFHTNKSANHGIWNEYFA